MNCKPGCMAMIVDRIQLVSRGAAELADVNVVGYIVHVLTVDVTAKAPQFILPIWNIEPFVAPNGWRVDKVSDKVLRMIQSPGEDAVDQIVARLGRPERTVQDVLKHNESLRRASARLNRYLERSEGDE